MRVTPRLRLGAASLAVELASLEQSRAHPERQLFSGKPAAPVDDAPCDGQGNVVCHGASRAGDPLAMLILDKARTLDLMIARSEQVVVPDDYHARWTSRRLAIYEPASVVQLPALLPPELARLEPERATAA